MLGGGMVLTHRRRAHRARRRRPAAAARPARRRRAARRSRPATRRTRWPGWRWRSSAVRAVPALRGRWLARRGRDRCSRSSSARRGSTCACTGSSDVVGGLGRGGDVLRARARSSAWSSPSCVTMSAAPHEQRVDHVPGRRVQRRVRARGLGRPDRVPAWQSYSRAWERVAAVFLSLYVVAAFMLVGVGRRRARSSGSGTGSRL